jgi:NADPH:quinone reductase-like Zn-dependent oxidoreductase
MKAAVLERFGPADAFTVREVDDPPERPGWASVRLRASALNWHDVLVRRGRYQSPLPHIAGADGAGERLDTGEPVIILPSLFWGDRDEAPEPAWEILGDATAGTYAELVSVPEECLVVKPPGLSWPAAAALPLVGVTCYRALFTRAKLVAGESVLVIGAGGGVATMALALAVAAGATVFVTASTPDKLARAVEAGAAGGVVHADPGWPEGVRAQSPEGRGFDVVVDSVGLWEKSIAALRPGGRLVVLGANVAEHADMDIRRFYFGQYTLLGTTMGSPRDFHGLLDLVSAGAVAPPVIGATFTLDEVADAHRLMESGSSVGKIVLLHD